MTSLGDRLRYYRQLKGLTQENLAAACGLTKDYISKLERSEQENPQIKTVEAIAKALEVNPTTLLAGAFKDDLAEDPPYEQETGEHIPVVGYANAGKSQNRVAYDDAGYPVGWGFRTFPKPSDFHDPHGYVVLIKGESMLPMREGWRLVVSPSAEVKDTDDVIVRTKTGDVYYKQVKMKGDTIILKSFNPIFDPIILDREEIEWMHKVWAIYPDHG